MVLYSIFTDYDITKALQSINKYYGLLINHVLIVKYVWEGISW